VPKVTPGRDYIAHSLFYFLGFREALLFGSRPDELIIDVHIKHATRGIRNQRNFHQLLFKSIE